MQLRPHSDCVAPGFLIHCAGFESQAWYQQLYEFSAPQDGNASAEDEADVVPVLVRNVIAPLALHMAERVRPEYRAISKQCALFFSQGKSSIEGFHPAVPIVSLSAV